jgi:hypothetical protein
MFPSHFMAPYGERSITIRRATTEDRHAIQHVADRDTRRAPASDVLIAEVDGEVVAAKPLDGGEPVADPFRASAEVVRMLEIRAEHMRGADKVPADALSRRGLRRALRAW